MLAIINGRADLARAYRADQEPEGERIRYQVTSIGIVPEGNVTGLIISSDGLYLYTHPLFRFFNPPVLIPWTHIKFARKHRFILAERYVLRLGSATTITIKRHAYDKLKELIAS